MYGVESKVWGVGCLEELVPEACAAHRMGLPGFGGSVDGVPVVAHRVSQRELQSAWEVGGTVS